MRKVAVYGGTRNLYDTMRVAVNSLLVNNDVDAVYLMIEDDFFPHPMGEKVKTINVSNQTFFPENGVNFKCKWTYMSFMRLALPTILPDENRVLWLDCDTIVDADITELFEMDLQGKCFGAVQEFEKSIRVGKYFNAGVLLMDLQRMREIGIEKPLIEFVNTIKAGLPDQDALNLIGYEEIVPIPSKYNVCNYTDPSQEMKIYHFAAVKQYDGIPIYDKYAGRKGYKTLIAVPCLDMINTDFARCLFEMQKDTETAITFAQGTLVYEARNMIANNAIRCGFDRVLWLDSDMIIPPDAMKRLAEDMEGKDFVTALYFRRKPPAKPVVYNEVRWEVKEHQVDTTTKSFTDYPEDQIFEIQGAGFGCCMTSVDLLKAVVEMYGSPFTPMLGMGEDLAFCWRVMQTGRKMYCDSRIKCGHIGQYIYTEKDRVKE